MKLNRLSSVLPLALLALTGCTGGSGDGAGLTPQNAEEAIGKLSDENRRAYEAWKKQVVKACDPSQAFGLESHRAPDNGIDGGALVEFNGGSVVFTEDNGFVVLSGYETFSGQGESKVENSSSGLGNDHSITAHTKRSGSTCEVFLYGQKVHETFIARRFDLGSQWMQGKVAQANSGPATIDLIGTQDLGEATRHGVSDVVRTALGSSSYGVSLMARKLGLTNEQAAALFVAGTSKANESAIGVSGESQIIWSQLNDGTLVARSEKLRRFFSGSAGALPLEVRLPIRQFKFALTENTSDRGNLKLDVRVSIVNVDGVSQFTLESMQPRGLVAYDRTEGLECAANRGNAFVGRRSTPNSVQPSYSKVFGPCSTLFPEVEDAAIESRLVTTMIPRLFSRVTPSPQTNYGGWDSVLSKLAVQILERGEDLRIELDPRGETIVVARIGDHLNAIHESVTNNSKLIVIKDSIYQMGLSWAFMGESVPALKIREIVNAAGNTIDPFQASTVRLLNDLGRFPYGYEEQLQFARSLDADYKSEGTKAITLARNLDYLDFERQVFDLVLQLRTSRSELSEWSYRMTVVKNEIDRFANLNEVKGKLTSLAIKWLKNGEAQPTEVANIFGAIDNVSTAFPQSTQRLLENLSKGLGENRATIEFARSLTPEYKQLAQDIVRFSKELDHESWGSSFASQILQNKPSIAQLQTWNETLSSASAFTQREHARTQGDTSNEWRRKSVIKTAIDEGWSRSDFEMLEAFAEVARFESSCDREKGASSRAHCASSRLFNRQRGMYFDPAFAGRYARVARDFQSYLSSIAGHEHHSLQREMLGELFGFQPLWSRCDSSSFETKASTLKQQMNAYITARDGSEQWRLERAISDTLDNCR